MKKGQKSQTEGIESFSQTEMFTSPREKDWNAVFGRRDPWKAASLASLCDGRWVEGTARRSEKASG